MHVDVNDVSITTQRTPLSVRWGAILAGLVVGISVNLLLLLIGASVGLAVFSPGEGGREVTLAAALWNTVCMVVAAFVGAYVAARSAGLRRTSDGVLHGVVSWGVTLLVSVMVATTAGGAAFGTLLSAAAGGGSAGAGAEAGRDLVQGDREQAVVALQERLGLSAEQANQVVDQALLLAGRDEGVSPEAEAAAEDSLRAASVASGWLSGAILLSLLAAMGGGLMGARGTRRLESVRHRRAVEPEPMAPRGPPAGSPQREV